MVDQEIAFTIVKAKLRIICFETIVAPVEITAPVVLGNEVLYKLSHSEISITWNKMRYR